MSKSLARPCARLMRPTIFAVLALVAGIGVAGAAEEGMIWTVKTSGGLASLAYGPLDPAETPVFLLSCFSDMDVVVLDVHKPVKGGKVGDPLTIELSSAKANAPLQGEVAKDDETGDTFGEASDVKVKPVLEVLRDKGPVTLKMDDTIITLPEEGRPETVAKFAEDCTTE